MVALIKLRIFLRFISYLLAHQMHIEIDKGIDKPLKGRYTHHMRVYFTDSSMICSKMAKICICIRKTRTDVEKALIVFLFRPDMFLPT